MTTRRRTRLILLFGGRSVEHEISCISALYVMRTVDHANYDVVPVGITREGRWVDAAGARAVMTTDATALPSPDTIGGAELDPWDVLLPAGADRADTVAFPLLHGPLGEDGTLQGLCEMARVPYVGAGVLAASTAMHKAVCKELLAFNSLPQARWLSGTESALDAAFHVRVADELGYPCFVKPANLGSSIGITKVQGAGGLGSALCTALRYDDTVVVEEAVEGREIGVAVIGNAAHRVSAPCEIVPSREFYDFEDKYLARGSTFHVPASLGETETETVRQLAGRAYAALRMNGMARVDFFYEERGRGFLVNEINAIPGFRSVFPGMWEASGLSRTALIDELVRLAVERWVRRERFEISRHHA